MPKCAVSLRWASAAEADNLAGTHPAVGPRVLGKRGLPSGSRPGRLHDGLLRKEELRVISLPACGQALLFYGELTVPFGGRCPVVVCALTGETWAVSAGFSH